MEFYQFVFLKVVEIISQETRQLTGACPKVGSSSWFLFAAVLAPCQGSQQLETPADASNVWCNLRQKSQRENTPQYFGTPVQNKNKTTTKRSFGSAALF